MGGSEWLAGWREKSVFSAGDPLRVDEGEARLTKSLQLQELRRDQHRLLSLKNLVVVLRSCLRRTVWHASVFLGLGASPL